jgi:hypothetical protein
MIEKDSHSLLLLEMAKAGFTTLYKKEKWFIQDLVEPPSSAGKQREGSDEKASEHGDKWGREREVRSGLIRAICVHKTAYKLIDPSGAFLDGAKITGLLNLNSVSIPFPLVFQNCYFDQAPQFMEASIPELNLERSFAPALNADLLVVKGYLMLRDFTCHGEAQLRLSHISGNLDCSGGTFSNPDKLDSKGKPDPDTGTALTADGAIIDGFVLLRNNDDRPFRSEGEVRFLGAQIRGDLDLTGSRLDHLANPMFQGRGVALNAERTNVRGTVFLGQGFESKGEVRFQDAQIGGNFGCAGGHFENLSIIGDVAIGPTLILDRIYIADAAQFGRMNDIPFRLIGSMSLVDARVGGGSGPGWSRSAFS